MGTRRIRRPVGVVVLGAVGLAGCAAAPTPAPSGASRTSLASTPSGVESSTGIPSPSSTITDAQAALQAEAVEAVKQYYAAWNRALVSRDGSEVRAMSLPGCEACAMDLADLAAFKAKNQTVRGGLITLTNLRGLPGVDAGIPVEGDATRAAAQVFSSNGTLVKTYPQDTAINRLWVVARSGGRLKVKGIS